MLFNMIITQQGHFLKLPQMILLQQHNYPIPQWAACVTILLYIKYCSSSHHHEEANLAFGDMVWRESISHRALFVVPVMPHHQDWKDWSC